MKVSVIIPVWNGAEVILECLAAIHTNSGDELLEVICVNNASEDDSAVLIAEQYPQVKLLDQPINLGFAGGVNAGMQTARGDVFVLLNQDCVVQPNWLPPLLETFAKRPDAGIVGATILNPDGSLNHAGAALQRPQAVGVHLAEVKGEQPYPVDYVTGALFAIHRKAWETVGPFDEDFYPAYFEETDYCYRARVKGFETVYAPQSKATHLFSSKEWQADPIKHYANQYQSRYRFVSKHFDASELAAFFASEAEAIAEEIYFEHGVGRIVAARHTLRVLPGIIRQRQAGLGDAMTEPMARQIQLGFTNILRQAFSQLESRNAQMQQWDETEARLTELRQREYDLMTRIYFKDPTANTAETKWQRFVRLFIKRPLSFISGRDYLLLAELNTVHVARMDQMNKRLAQTEQRLKILEALTNYDYR